MDKLELTSEFSDVTQGKIIRPIFAALYGLNGVGKTTLASQAPTPIFLGLESGTFQLPVARFPKCRTLADFFGQLGRLATLAHPFKTIVVDTVDRLEALIWQQVCQEDNIESIEHYQGGFGKGYVRSAEIFRRIIEELSELASRFHILLIGHVVVRSYQDPALASGYDRYQLKIHERAAGVIREAVDLMAFCTYRQELIRGDKKNKAGTRALTDGSRVLYTEFRPAFDAKNRFGLPFEMPLEWAPLAKAIRGYYDNDKPKTEEPESK
jgi:hypothetical protein